MSGPNYYSQNFNPSGAPQPRKQYQYDPGQYDAPPVHSKPPSGQRSAPPSTRNSTASKPLSIRDIDLNASQYSIGSNASTMRLGGVDYPVGSRIGSSGLFVIGAPNEPKETNSNLNRSQPSIAGPSVAGSHRGLVQKSMGYVSQGYGFEDWNWPVIRFSLFILIIALILALLAAAIGLSIKQTDKCSFGFEWWQGAAVYQVPVGLYRDYGSDGYGDLEGLAFSMSYIEKLGVKVVLLSHFMPSLIPSWVDYTSFQGVDSRLGSQDQMRDVLSQFKDSGIHVILEMDISYTSVNHQWFDESRRTSIGSGNFRKDREDFYTWRSQPDLSLTNGNWSRDSVRSQYYLHANNDQRPLVNYSNPLVVDEMANDLEYWLRMGVDGFFIRDASQMHTQSPGSTAVVLNKFREKLNGYSSEERKILVLNADYLESVKQKSPSSHRLMLDLVDLVHVPLSLKAKNHTIQLSTEVEAGLQWQRNSEDPWVMWTVRPMKTIERIHLAAVQLFLLSIPGTPCLVAGEEVERFLLEEEKHKTLLWSSSNLPYNSASITSEQYLEYLKKIIALRNSEYSLRKDHEDVGLHVKEFNINFLYADAYTILFERYYGRSDAFYYAANLGDRNFERDWSRFAPYGDVVASSQDGRGNDRVELKHILMSPGEAVVLRVKK